MLVKGFAALVRGLSLEAKMARATSIALWWCSRVGGRVSEIAERTSVSTCWIICEIMQREILVELRLGLGLGLEHSALEAALAGQQTQ